MPQLAMRKLRLKLFCFILGLSNPSLTSYLIYGFNFSSLCPAASIVAGCLQYAIRRNLLPISCRCGG